MLKSLKMTTQNVNMNLFFETNGPFIFSFVTLFSFLLFCNKIKNFLEDASYETRVRDLLDETQQRRQNLVNEMASIVANKVTGSPKVLNEPRRVDFTQKDFAITKPIRMVYVDPPVYLWDIITDGSWDDMNALLDFDERRYHNLCLICGCFLICVLTGNPLLLLGFLGHLYLGVSHERVQRKTPQQAASYTHRQSGVYMAFNVIALVSLHSLIFSFEDWISRITFSQIPFSSATSQVSLMAIVVPLVLIDLNCFRRLRTLNGETFVPLPFILIPITILSGGSTGITNGCQSHIHLPYPYFAVCLLFFCVCTRKPTYRSTVFLVLSHGLWTGALVYHILTDEICRIGTLAATVNAVACTCSNICSVYHPAHNNFAFDTTDLGHKFWRILVVLSRLNGNQDDDIQNLERRAQILEMRAQILEMRAQICEGGITEADLLRLVAIADGVLSKLNIDAAWPTFSIFASQFFQGVFFLGIIYVNYSQYGQFALDAGSNGHDILVGGVVLIIVVVWITPFWRNELVSQDFRFLFRVLCFTSVSMMITFHCRVQNSVPPFVSALAYVFDAWGWWMSSSTRINMTDIRIASMTVSLVKVLSFSSLSTLASQLSSTIVLAELLDIRTQRLITKNDHVLIAFLRVLSFLTLLFGFPRTFVDIIVAAILVVPFSFYLQHEQL